MLWRRLTNVLAENILRLRLGATLQIEQNTATAAAGAATLNGTAGKVTTEALTTAAGAAYTLTLTNSKIGANDSVFVTVDNGTNTTAGIEVGRVTPSAGQVVILVWNRHAADALDGTLKIGFLVVKKAS